MWDIAMDCYYINLDSSIQRRSNIESNFTACKKQEWSLTRFPALDTRYVLSNGVKGAVSDREKACFCSHKALINSLAGHASPVLILEDDAVLGRKTCRMIDRLIPVTQDWDILFTDICIPAIDSMLRLLKLRRQFVQEQRVVTLDISKLEFCGATAYVLNPESIVRIAGLLNSIDEINTPYDLIIRDWVRESKLKGFAFFPFVTTLSNLAESSQIQDEDSQLTDLVWNTFRKMMWLERRREDYGTALGRIRDTLCDDELIEFGTLFSSMASPRYRIK